MAQVAIIFLKKDKQTMVYVYHGILLSNKNGHTMYIHNNTINLKTW